MFTYIVALVLPVDASTTRISISLIEIMRDLVRATEKEVKML
jgi:hypothetical protein